MSVRVSTWAWQQDVPLASAKLVLLKLADTANDEGECWPHQVTIAQDCGCSVRTVKSHVATLRDLGLLEIKQRPGMGNKNSYRLLWDVEVEGADLAPSESEQRGNVLPLQKGNLLPLPRTVSEPSSPEVKNTSGAGQSKSKGPHQLMWDALADALGFSPTNDLMRGRWNKAIKHLRQSGATPEQIGPTLAEMRKAWPNAEASPLSLASNWDRFKVVVEARTPPCPGCGVGGGGHSEDCPTLGDAA